LIGEVDKVFLQSGDMLTEVLTIMSATYHLNYSQRTIRQWCDEGKIEAFKVANVWFIPITEIARLKRRDHK
jgi:hypothetical protein